MLYMKYVFFAIITMWIFVLSKKTFLVVHIWVPFIIREVGAFFKAFV